MSDPWTAIGCKLNVQSLFKVLEFNKPPAGSIKAIPLGPIQIHNVLKEASSMITNSFLFYFVRDVQEST